MKKAYILPGLIVILLLNLVAYFPAFKAELLSIKDPMYVQNNEAIQALTLNNLQDIFFSVKESYYPLTLLSYSIDYSFTQLHPFLFHCTNVVLHLMNVFLVFLFIFRLLYDKKKENAALIALFTAALFGLATAQLTSVLWVSERKTLLFSFFYFLSLIQYLKFLRVHSRSALYCSLFLFILACAASGKALSLLFVLPAIDMYYGKKIIFRYFLKEKIVFIIVAFFFALINITAFLNNNTCPEGNTYGFFEHIVLAFYNFSLYLQKSIYTSSSVFVWAYPEKIQGHLPYTLFLYMLPVLLLFFLVFRFLRKNKLLVLVLGFFSIHIVMMLIMSSFSLHMCEVSNLYLPATGIYLLLALCICYLKIIHPRLSAIYIVILVLFVLLSVYKNHIKSHIWKNSFSLSKSIMEEDPENLRYLIRSNLFFPDSYPEQAVSTEYSETAGNGKHSESNRTESLEKFLESMDDPKSTEKDQSLRIQDLLEKTRKTPKNHKSYQSYMSALVQAFFERGIARGKQGAYAESNKDFDRVIKLNPAHADAYFNKAYNLYKTAVLFEALDHLNSALDIHSDFVEAYAFRGEIRTQVGDFNNALSDFDSVIMKNPKYPKIREARNKCVYIFENNLRALDMIFRKEYEAAIAYYDLGIEHHPEMPVLYSNRGYVKAENGDIQGAIKDYNKALNLCRDYSYAYNNRAYAYLKMGDTDQALEDAHKSLMLDAENPYSYRIRALIYIQLKRINEACKDIERALDLNYTGLYDDELVHLRKKHCLQN
jgi:protein O-mannosyl-transferase